MGMIIQNGKQYFPVYNDSEIKALPTVSTASGSIATFDTDMTENLVEVKCQIVAQQSGSGTPSPSNPRPITTYTSLNLSHSGADTSNPNVTNIPFGQTVANGVLDVTSGKLKITYKYVKANDKNWYFNTYLGKSSVYCAFTDCDNSQTTEFPTGKRPIICNIAEFSSGNEPIADQNITFWGGINNNKNCFVSCPTITDVDITTWQNYIANNDVYIAYSCVPEYVQLSATEIQALLNENNIWCDTGDTEVKFLLTVGKAIS